MEDRATPEARRPPRAGAGGAEHTRGWPLVVLATVAGVAALKAAKPVLLPAVTAAFLIALAWPVERWLEQRLPRPLALVATALGVLVVAGFLVWGLVWSIEILLERAPELGPRLQSLAREAGAQLRAWGIPLPTGPDGQLPVAERVAGLMADAVPAIYSAVALLGLVFAFFVLGLLEVPDVRARVEHRLRPRIGDALLEGAGRIAGTVRRFLVAWTITCVVSGVLTGLFCLVMGLDLAFFWGLQAFLLNFIPTIGPTVATLPPTLYALLQFEDLLRPTLVFFGVGAIQFLIGNFVDPKIAGRVLSLSPTLILLAVLFWGWAWGVLGALLAVPLTIAALIVLDEFDAIRWLPELVWTEGKDRGERGRANDGP